MRISEWSSDVCSSDLVGDLGAEDRGIRLLIVAADLDGVGALSDPSRLADLRHSPDGLLERRRYDAALQGALTVHGVDEHRSRLLLQAPHERCDQAALQRLLGEDQEHQQPDGGDQETEARLRSEEHTSELQSLMRISYAVLCLKKKNQ